MVLLTSWDCSHWHSWIHVETWRMLTTKHCLHMSCIVRQMVTSQLSTMMTPGTLYIPAKLTDPPFPLPVTSIQVATAAPLCSNEDSAIPQPPPRPQLCPSCSYHCIPWPALLWFLTYFWHIAALLVSCAGGAPYLLWGSCLCCLCFPWQLLLLFLWQTSR